MHEATPKELSSRGAVADFDEEESQVRVATVIASEKND